MKAITIKQPWASLIITGIKDIENRTWKTNYRGRVLIHSAKLPDKMKFEFAGQATVKEIQLSSVLNDADEKDLYECIIGSVEIVDCVMNHPSIWAEKTSPALEMGGISIYNWVLANPIIFPEPIPAKGKLSFWELDIQRCYKTNLPCKFNCSGLCKESF